MRRPILLAAVLALAIAAPVSAAKPVLGSISTDAASYVIGDTVTFTATEGVIDIHCVDSTGTVLLGGGLVRGDHDFVVGYSQRWAANPVPLTCTAYLIDLLHNRLVTLASTEFGVAP